uniref:Uncharacterized protein n=1 Tax=Panagrolaimus sp. ES5 TaxID=591445 RepID=A0AC34FN44_9BILA
MVRICSIQSLSFDNVSIKEEYGNDVEVADLLKEIPNIERFEYIFKESESMSSAAQSLAKLEPLSKLCEFSLFNIQNGFDFTAFEEFIEKNLEVFYDIEFCGSTEFFDKIKCIEKNLLYSKKEN